MVLIAEKIFSNPRQWQTSTRGAEIVIDLRKVKKWKFYEDYEEFGAEFFEAIL